MFRHLFILVAMSSVVLGAVYILNPEPKPEEYADCDGCWVSEINTFIPLGESVPSPTECQQYNCNSNNVQIYTCGAVAYNETLCELTYDSSLPYPGCCAKVICREAGN